MDFNWLILALAAVVLLSYLFDVFGRKVRFPSVMLLIGCGIGLRLALDSVDLEIPFLSVLLPVIGTLGLILIVLEGALDLKLTREKSGLIGRALTSATLGILVTGGLIAWAMHWHFDLAWQRAWLYAIALSVVSSAVVIPAASALRKADREFVIYESSISDIVGVLLFYAVLEHSGGFAETSLLAVGQIVVSIFVGFIFGVALYWLIHRSTHHVRFLPMIFGIAMLYAAGKLINLAPLVMVVWVDGIALALLVVGLALHLRRSHY